MAAISSKDISIQWNARLCEVQGKPGYFHTWEFYSKPLEASLLLGGAPAGVFSKVFAIVEFSDGVRRVDPMDVKFCDQENAILATMEKKQKEKSDGSI